MKKSTKLLAAAGIAAGGMLGILFAPESGAENRKKLKKRLRKLAAVLNGECSKSKLLLAKEKLGQQKTVIERHLQSIESRLAGYDENE